MRRTVLALRALRALDQHDGLLQAAELASLLGSTPQFVPQVLNPLVRAGWLASEPGRNGGYRVDTDLAGRSILELIELIEGRTDNGTCVLNGGPCPGSGTCSLHEAWFDARGALLSRLGASPISDRTPTTSKRKTA